MLNSRHAQRQRRTWKSRAHRNHVARTHLYRHPRQNASRDRRPRSALGRRVHCGTRPRTTRACAWCASASGPTKTRRATHKEHERIDTMPESELRRLLLDCARIGEVHASTWSNSKPEALIATAQGVRIDTGKIVKRARMNWRRKPPRPPNHRRARKPRAPNSQR